MAKIVILISFKKTRRTCCFFLGLMVPHCESLIERIDQLDSADAIKKNLFTVAEDESLDDVEGHEGDFPIYLDQDESVYEAYGLEHIPTVFILNDQGEVLGSAQGEEDSLTLLQEYASYNQ
ncbi:MAG: TlpA family protein disulfide reductase [Adlercreutzia equolifaciens]|nr:redoxin family protein [Adlercreutzia equolifaciens]